MGKSFIASKFRSVLIVSTFAMLGEYLVLLSDNLIAGNILGESALSAITLVTPFFSFAVFLAFLIALGTDIVISRCVGQMDRQQANNFFSQAVILCVGLGLALTIIYLFAGDYILGMFQAEPAIVDYAKEYLRFIKWLPLPLMLNNLFYQIVLNDGGEKYCTVGSGVQLFGNIVLSAVLCMIMGISGISLATVIANCAESIILLIYLFTSSTEVRFVWYINGRSILSVLKYSINDSIVYLYMTIFESVLNVFLLREVGSGAIITFSVIVNLVSLLNNGFDGVGEAISPLVNVYQGEENQIGIKKTMKVANKTALIEGVGVMILLFVLSPVIPRMFGIHDSILIKQTAISVCIYAIVSIAFSFAMLYTSYYIYIERIGLSLVMTTLYQLVIPLICAIAGGKLFGMYGVWGGMSVGGILALICDACIVKFFYKDKTFPYLLDKKILETQLSYDAAENQEGVMQIVDQVERDLKERNVPEKRVYRTMLLIEETEMLAVEKSNQKKGMIECTIFIKADELVLILRDNGMRNDVTDIDGNVTSFRTFAGLNIIGNHRKKGYILTSGYNRTIYHVD